MAVALRQLAECDLIAVDRIQRSAYGPDFLEDLAVFADKFARYPAGCWVAEVDGQVVGYLFSHPAQFSAPPSLNKLLESWSSPDSYFIHDLAVQPTQRCQGVAHLLLGSAFAQAESLGFNSIALVSVQNSRGFWERRGFHVVLEAEPAVEKVRRSYGPQAQYMIRDSGELPAVLDDLDKNREGGHG